MSKYQFAESDIYLPDTDIPRNHLGIETPDLLHEVEATLLQQSYTRFITELDPSILCVQRADSSKLQQLILQGLRRT